MIIFGLINSVSAQTADELNAESKKWLAQDSMELAVSLMKRAAELGSPEAQYNYGYYLMYTVNDESSKREAIEWFRKSSDGGFNDGHYAMMMVYGNGMGTNEDHESAFKYALKCANNNDPTCLWNVANAYYSGTGVTQDDDKFVEWLLRLCALPNPENITQSGAITSARVELARMYRDGELVQRDMEKSMAWFLVYNEHKSDLSVFEQQNIKTEIKALQRELTDEQIAQAEVEAQKFYGRPLQKAVLLLKEEI